MRIVTVVPVAMVIAAGGAPGVGGDDPGPGGGLPGGVVGGSLGAATGGAAASPLSYA